MKQQTKHKLLLLLIFILASVSTFYFEMEVRWLIQELFMSSTNNAIFFYGKSFHFFPSAYFTFGFGLYAVVLISFLKSFRFKGIVLFLAYTLLSFAAFFYLICYVVAFMKIVECTACSDGRRGLQYHEINYDGIFMSALTFSMIPLTIYFFVKKNGQNRLKRKGVFLSESQA